MGEEYGELAPFQYFISHSDANLIAAVRKGRKEEFARFGRHGEVPDPQAEETFRRSRLNWSLRKEGTHQILVAFYAALLRLRRCVPALSNLSKRDTRAWVCSPTTMGVERRCGSDRMMALFNFGDAAVPVCAEMGAGAWQKVLDSAEPRWAGSGTTSPGAFEVDESVSLEIAATSFSLFRRLMGDPRDSAI
jgi:maltooligosyltrehalose trehalohydrolase